MGKRKSKNTSTINKKKPKLCENLLVIEEKKEIDTILKNTKGKIFEVEELLKKKTIKGNTYYFVKWKNYDERFNQWVERKGI